ncbi:MAG: hypothetical protein ACYC60_19090 [Thermoanaerobaculia bacterium]
MIVAVEDLLSEVVARQLVAQVRSDLSIEVLLRRNGRGYIERKAADLNRTAQRLPVLNLAELDRPEPCPAELIEQILGAPPARMLLFRLAVMEIESWILADREPFARFLGVPMHRIPANTDAIERPKEFIVSLARKSRRKGIRDDLLPASGGTAAVGPAFNPTIANFVMNEWSCSRAVDASLSLARAADRLRQAFR